MKGRVFHAPGFESLRGPSARLGEKHVCIQGQIHVTLMDNRGTVECGNIRQCDGSCGFEEVEIPAQFIPEIRRHFHLKAV